jgi:hypothetical protein
MVSANARYFANMTELFGLVGSNAMAGCIGLSHAEVEVIAPAVDLLMR